MEKKQEISSRQNTSRMDLGGIKDLHRFSSVRDGKWGTLPLKLDYQQKPMNETCISINETRLFRLEDQPKLELKLFSMAENKQ